MAILVFGVPIVAAIVILTARGWNSQPWSPGERRGRLLLAVVIGLPLAVVAFALGVGACAAAVPVALAGRRRVAFVAAAAPVIAPFVTALAATSPNTVGWCLF